MEGLNVRKRDFRTSLQKASGDSGQHFINQMDLVLTRGLVFKNQEDINTQTVFDHCNHGVSHGAVRPDLDASCGGSIWSGHRFCDKLGLPAAEHDKRHRRLSRDVSRLYSCTWDALDLMFPERVVD